MVSPKPLKHQSIATFNRMFAPRLRRQARRNGCPLPKAINVVSCYGKHDGISQGATLQCIAFGKPGINAKPVDVTAAMINPFSG